MYRHAFSAAVAAAWLTACTNPPGGGNGMYCRTDAECVRICANLGLTGGRCLGETCMCDEAPPDGGDDGAAETGDDGAGETGDDGAPENPDACVPDECAGRCLGAGYAVGECIDDDCRCSEPLDPCTPPVCGPEELCGESGFGNGVDDDCDTEVDEVCECENPGVTMECFPGNPAPCPPGSSCRGSCARGIQRCSPEFRNWGPCEGAILPAIEACDGADNDCDGLYDEDIIGCDSPVNCPGSVSAAPLTWVALDGTAIYPDARPPHDSWTWEIFCPATIPPGMCPVPEDPAAKNTRVFLAASGTYRARATIRVGSDTYTCEFAILTQGAGLRVELTWDTQGEGRGDTDVDLHLHKWGPMTEFFSDDDCYYPNCTASDFRWGGGVDWGLARTTDVSACSGAPRGEGRTWIELDYCNNPRLDVDIVSCDPAVTDPNGDYCAPENINVDNPPLGEPFRIMVNYFSDHGYAGITNATVNVYCGGAPRATFGPQPLVNGDSYGSNNDNWLVADVRFYTGPCGELDCRIVPILDGAGRPVVQRGASFGPPWSTF